MDPKDYTRFGLAAVQVAPGCSADFMFVGFVEECLKNGHAVVYVSSGRSFENFRIAASKLSIQLRAELFTYIEMGSLVGSCLDEPTGPKLLSKIDSALCTTGDRKVLVVLDDITLIGDNDDGIRDEIFLIANVEKLVQPERSLIVFGTYRNVYEYGFRLPLQVYIKPIGSGFGKTVTGQVNVVSYPTLLATLPSNSCFHYLVGERSIKMFYPGTASIL